jgi:hypothetical protein
MAGQVVVAINGVAILALLRIVAGSTAIEFAHRRSHKPTHYSRATL